MGTRMIRVLIVDDSAFMRRMLEETLQREGDIEVVGVAADGEEALSKSADLQPDVITLDLVMPRLDGIGFLREQSRRVRIPALVVSKLENEHDLVLSALELGALDIVQKPGAPGDVTMSDMTRDLLAKIRATVSVGEGIPGISPKNPEIAPAEAPDDADSVTISRFPPAAAEQADDPTAKHRCDEAVAEIVLIGTSAGGPHALMQILPSLPADFPLPIVVAIHMPSGYTRAFAERLDQVCALEVTEASEGDPVIPGRILIAPAGVHTRFEQCGVHVCVRLSARPFDLPHRPSIDVLFASAADVYGRNAAAFVLTGMGDDGLQGARRISDRGGMVIAESPESCIVYGMPRAVVEAGIAAYVTPLDQIATRMCMLHPLLQ